MPVEERIGGFTSGELKVASFWTRNYLKLRRAGYTTLGVVCALLWGYALIGLLDAYAISYPRESRINRDIALNQQLLASLQSDQPLDVSSSDVSVFSTTDNRFDMAVEISNPNAQWWIEFNYRFNLSGEQTPQRTGYILPQSTQVVTELGFKPTQRGGRSATLVVENIRWHRMDPNFAGAVYKDFAASRFNMSFDDIKYDTDITIGEKRVGQTSFTLNNKSGYGYWNVDLVVKLYRGGSVVAMNKITAHNVSPGEKRPMKIVWLENLPSISKTEIIPQVNLLEPDAYLKTEYFQ